MFIGNLNVNVTVDDIYERFGLKTTKYLNYNTYVEMLLNCKGQTRNFDFTSVPEYVRKDLLKLNNTQFWKKDLVIEAARSEGETAKSTMKSNHKYQTTSSWEPFSGKPRCVLES